MCYDFMVVAFDKCQSDFCQTEACTLVLELKPITLLVCGLVLQGIGYISNTWKIL